MLCQKKLIIGFGILFSVFVSALSSSSSYATDLSTTISSGTSVTRGQSVFSNCDSTCFSQYDYIIISPNNINYAGSSEFIMALTLTGYGDKRFRPFSFTDTYITIPSIATSLVYDSSMTYAFDVTFTLTDTLPNSGCPPVPECPPTPVIPDNPYDPKFDEVIQAIYTIGGVILVLYFFFSIYQIIIKGGRA